MLSVRRSFTARIQFKFRDFSNDEQPNAGFKKVCEDNGLCLRLNLKTRCVYQRDMGYCHIYSPLNMTLNKTVNDQFTCQSDGLVLIIWAVLGQLQRLESQ